MMSAVNPFERRRVFSVVGATGVAFGMTYPFVVVLAHDLGASSSLAGVVSGGNVLSMMFVDGLGTRAIARLDPRLVLVAALVSFGIGSAAAAAAPNVVVLLCSRLFEGAGIALFMTGGIHLVSRGVVERERGRVIGTFNACWFFGAAAGPLLGGAIAQTANGVNGVRRTFAACAVVSLACALLAYLALPRYSAGGRRAHLSLPPLGLLRGNSRLVRAIVLGGHGEAVRDGFMMVLLPLAGAAAGLSGLEIGVVLTLMALADVASMHVSGHLADRFGRARPLVIALAVAGGTALAGIGVGAIVGFCVLALALGSMLGAAWVLPPTMVLDLADDAEAAVTGYRLSSDIGWLIGASGSGAAIQIIGTRGAFATMAILLFGGALLTASIGDTRRSPPPLPPTSILEVAS
jgi:MFS family permease